MELAVTGRIQVASHSQTQTMDYDGPVGARGAYSSGQSSCHANVTFIYVYSGEYKWGPGPCVWPPDTGTSYLDTILVRGTGRVERAIGFREYSYECSPAPRCHTYSGNQTVSVRVLPAGVKIVASKQMVTINDWVTFTATGNPDSIGGVKVPIKVTAWQWIPAGGGTGQTGQCFPNSNPCSRQIKEAGTMKVTAIVQGVEQTATVIVECRITVPSPDSVLNTPQVRREFMAQLAASNPDSTPESLKRKERGGLIWQMQDGSYFAQTVADPLATQCAYTPSQGTAPPNAVTYVALFHTHPNKPGHKVYGCPDSPAGVPQSQFPGDGKEVPLAGDKAKNGGGSPADWRFARDQTLPVFVVDADGTVWRLDPQVNDTSSNPAQIPNPNKFVFRALEGSSRTCDWVR